MSPKIQTKISELKSYFETREFDLIIEQAVNRIYEGGCALMMHPSANYSKHRCPPTDCYIVLGVDRERDRLHILWDLFHEFGHHLDEKKLKIEDLKNKEIVNTREKTAWTYADELFLNFPLLSEYKSNYITYRSNCLSSYDIVDYKGNGLEN